MTDILLVDDDPSAIQLLAQMLSDLSPLRFATNGLDALRLAHESAPDLVLLDAEMPGMGGFEVCEALKADPLLVDVPVIFVTSHGEPQFEVSGLALGAVDFIAKPVSRPLVVARVKTQLRIKLLNDELRRIATIDVLTGLANRRHFDNVLEREWRRTRRTGEPLVLLMIDVDHFKSFNDGQGHSAGDACLLSVAQALQRVSVRPADLVARHGGDEFAMLLPNTTRLGAEHVAVAVLEEVEALGLTVSVGVACYDDGSPCWRPATAPQVFADDSGPRCSPVALVKAADEALYAAKHAGRARAKLLDIAHVGAPQQACDIPAGGLRAV